MVTISCAEYEKLQARGKRISELESCVEILMEALRLERHRQFGASSEKMSEDAMDQLSFLFNEAEVYSDVVRTQEEATPVVAHKRHKKHEYTLDNIPEGMATEQIHHRLEGDALVCPNHGEIMTEIGTEIVRTLEIIPARTVVKEHIYHTYACQKCSKEGTETPVVKAPREKNIIPGSFATAEAISYIMTQKFVMGSPIYRQERELNRQGIPLSRQTMSNWILKASQVYLEPVYEQLHRELLHREKAKPVIFVVVPVSSCDSCQRFWVPFASDFAIWREFGREVLPLQQAGFGPFVKLIGEKLPLSGKEIP